MVKNMGRKQKSNDQQFFGMKILNHQKERIKKKLKKIINWVGYKKDLSYFLRNQKLKLIKNLKTAALVKHVKELMEPLAERIGTREKWQTQKPKQGTTDCISESCRKQTVLNGLSFIKLERYYLDSLLSSFTSQLKFHTFFLSLRSPPLFSTALLSEISDLHICLFLLTK